MDGLAHSLSRSACLFLSAGDTLKFSNEVCKRTFRGGGQGSLMDGAGSSAAYDLAIIGGAPNGSGMPFDAPACGGCTYPCDDGNLACKTSTSLMPPRIKPVAGA